MASNRTRRVEIVCAFPVLAWRICGKLWKASATPVITRPGFRPRTSENKSHNGTFGEIIGYWLQDVGCILDRFTRSSLCRCVHVGQPTSCPNCKILENLRKLEREAGPCFRVYIFVSYFLPDGVVREHGNKFALTVLSEGLYGTSCVFIWWNGYLDLFYLVHVLSLKVFCGCY